MTRYLLDANHLSAAIARVSRHRERIFERRRAGDRFGCCVPVLCELEAGILQTARPDEYHRRLNHLLDSVRIWPLDPELAGTFGELFMKAKARGRVISTIDLMLGALAVDRRLVILTADRDFEALPEIRTENWLV